MTEIVCVLRSTDDFGDDGAVREPRCICGGCYDGNGDGDVDYRPDCPQHGITPEAEAWQAARHTDTEEAPF